MNTHSPTPHSGGDRPGRRAATRSGGVPSMTQRQAEAYLLARDAVRRVQRTSTLLASISHGLTAGGGRSQSRPPPSH
jgi:hypothetical protein